MVMTRVERVEEGEAVEVKRVFVCIIDVGDYRTHRLYGCYEVGKKRFATMSEAARYLMARCGATVEEAQETIDNAPLYFEE